MSLVLLLVPGAAGYFAFFSDKPAKTVVGGPTRPVKFARSAQTLDDLLKISAERLGDVDLAEMNLLCATKLPGAEKLDIDHCLATLDQWARRVASETERHLYRVKDPRYADHYRHSEACLRAEMLLQVLQVDLGVRYDMAARHNFSFKDFRVAFIHGMIPAPGQTAADTPGGTCASLPVMYVAVGRRLGYPLKLATTKGHVFARWEGQNHTNPAWRERFNIEGSGEGYSSFEDDYYKTWPFKLTDQEVKANGYLVSLTPQEEFAEFLAARGHCGRDNGQPAFAARCYENAYRYDTARPAYRVWFSDAARASGYKPSTPELARLLALRAAEGEPEFVIAQQRADALAGKGDPLDEIEKINEINRQSAQRLVPARPPTPGGPQPALPYSPTPPQPGAVSPYRPYRHNRSPGNRLRHEQSERLLLTTGLGQTK